MKYAIANTTPAGTKPGAHARIPLERLPFVVQSTDADALARAQSTDLTDEVSAFAARLGEPTASGQDSLEEFYKGFVLRRPEADAERMGREAGEEVKRRGGALIAF